MRIGVEDGLGETLAESTNSEVTVEGERRAFDSKVQVQGTVKKQSTSTKGCQQVPKTRQLNRSFEVQAITRFVDTEKPNLSNIHKPDIDDSACLTLSPLSSASKTTSGCVLAR